jgi:predicted enzyme related to lactoylglutathione lyase
MITGLGAVSIWSSDLKNLLPFYRDVVGLTIQFESPEFVVFGAPGEATLGLGTHSEIHGRASDPGRHMVGFRTSDIQADAARMKSAGVEFIEEPNLQLGGGLWLATFKDPEGNICQLFQFIEG